MAGKKRLDGSGPGSRGAAAMKSSAKRIDVALGELDPLAGRGLQQMLREDEALRIIGSGLDDAALGRVVARRATCVVVLDEASVLKLSLPARLRSIRPAVGIIVLTHRPMREDGVRLLDIGVSCIATNAPAADILAAVHLTAAGKRLFASADGLIEWSHSPEAPVLTPRETDVFECLSVGQTYAQVAHALGITFETVRSHSACIRHKYGVRSKRELIGLPVPRRLRTEAD
jgi:DNA-binding NarL/FixJ family response regulator